MKAIQQETIAPNTGRAYIVRKGQQIRVSGRTIVDFVVFDHANLRERFDQARTKANQDKIFITRGDYLFSKSNRPMKRIVEDTYTEGTHNLQKGMCSASSYQLKAKLGKLDPHQERAIGEVPDHGCRENLSEALKPLGDSTRGYPEPFQHLHNHGGRWQNGKACPHHYPAVEGRPHGYGSGNRLPCGNHGCPDTNVGGKPVDVLIYED